MSDTSEQYEKIRQAIRSNIASIRVLIEQADALNNITLSIDDLIIKKRLTDSIEQLYKTADSLIKQTDDLFDQFAKLQSGRESLIVT